VSHIDHGAFGLRKCESQVEMDETDLADSSVVDFVVLFLAQTDLAKPQRSGCAHVP
jgi:hypothetical protein